MRKLDKTDIFIITVFVICCILAIIGVLTSCNTNPYEQYNCNPCWIVDRKITKYGKTVIIMNQDSLVYPILSDSLFEKGVGFIIK